MNLVEIVEMVVFQWKKWLILEWEDFQENLAKRRIINWLSIPGCDFHTSFLITSFFVVFIMSIFGFSAKNWGLGVLELLDTIFLLFGTVFVLRSSNFWTVRNFLFLNFFFLACLEFLDPRGFFIWTLHKRFF